MLVFEFLHANGVPHVAADAIELVTQNRPQILTFCARFDPRDHLVEGHSRRPALGGLGHFTQDGAVHLTNRLL